MAESGCSMCLAMNPDYLQPKERCASTSNRNFEGRQGQEDEPILYPQPWHLQLLLLVTLLMFETLAYWIRRRGKS